MKKRNPLAVVVFSVITLGIYALVWSVKTKNEMNRRGSHIPTAWLVIIPFVGIWWLWKYSEGVEKTTNGQVSAILSFVLLFLLSVIGMAIVQSEFNKVGALEPEQPSPNPAPQATAQPIQPLQPAEPVASPQPPTQVVAPEQPEQPHADNLPGNPPSTPPL